MFYLQGSHATCLADYCDVFRCDIISGRVKANFWDMALCNEADKMQLMHRCQVCRVVFSDTFDGVKFGLGAAKFGDQTILKLLMKLDVCVKRDIDLTEMVSLNSFLYSCV